MKLPEIFRRKHPPLQEIAAVPGFGPLASPNAPNAQNRTGTGTAGILGAWSGLPAPGDDLPGGGFGNSYGNSYQTFRRMQHDPQIRACLSTKKFAVLSRGWEVHAASDEKDDQAVADFVRFCLADMRGSLLDNLFDVLDALALGVSVLEINYKLIENGPWAGKVGLANLKSKDPGDFQFETDAFLNLLSLRGVSGERFDIEKFVIYSYMPVYENPLGTSDLRAAYSPWRIKGQLLQWWAKYLEKFGMPTVTGTYDAAKGYGLDQQRELLSIVAQVHNESAVVLPSDMSLSLLETARAGGAGFQDAIEYLDRALAKSILGQTLTSDSTGPASYALGSVHRDVLHFYLRKLQRDLEESVMGEQVLRRLVAYNFSPGTPVPRLSLGTLDDGQLAAAGTLITALVAGKVIAPEEPWIRSYLGLPGA